jgi:3-hydroxybutyryl-CoA dehydratase
MVERNTFTIGEYAKRTKLITEQDIDQFARITGDVNPIHIDEKFARNTYFGSRIAHGMLVASLISAVLGNELPGSGSIYLNQELHFLAPVHPGDEITARVEVTSWDPEKGRIELITEITNQESVTVVKGNAQLVMTSFLK